MNEYRHGPPPNKGEVWACEHPERPADGWTAFYDGCPACRIALDAAMRSQGVDIVVRIDWDDKAAHGLPVATRDVLEQWLEAP